MHATLQASNPLPSTTQKKKKKYFPSAAPPQSNGLFICGVYIKIFLLSFFLHTTLFYTWFRERQRQRKHPAGNVFRPLSMNHSFAFLLVEKNNNGERK